MVTRRYNPTAHSMARVRLDQALGHQEVTIGQMLESIESWEARPQKWTRKTELPDIMKQVALIKVLTEPLRGILN
jgi:hypothetical protein